MFEDENSNLDEATLSDVVITLGEHKKNEAVRNECDIKEHLQSAEDGQALYRTGVE